MIALRRKSRAVCLLGAYARVARSSPLRHIMHGLARNPRPDSRSRITCILFQGDEAKHAHFFQSASRHRADYSDMAVAMEQIETCLLVKKVGPDVPGNSTSCLDTVSGAAGCLSTNRVEPFILIPRESREGGESGGSIT